MAKKAGGAAKLLFDEEEQADGLGGLFGDEEPAQAASEKKGAAEAEGGKKVEKQLSAVNPNECKILGYILLTKPASLNVMDPVTVGCIFLNGSNKKYLLVLPFKKMQPTVTGSITLREAGLVSRM